MKLEDILQLDCRKSENKQIIQKALRKIKPFSSIPENEIISLEKIEKLARMLFNKYQLDITWILASHDDENMLYTISLRDLEKLELFYTVYGITLYEVMSKMILCAWSLTRKGIVKERKRNNK